MSKVLLVGAFGQGNPGDEALCAAFLRALPGDEVVVASRDPLSTARLHGVRAIANDPHVVARLVREVDGVVVGGGTVFKTLPASTGRRPTALLRQLCMLVAGARAAGKAVALVGVGAGDLRGPTARTLTRWLVRHVDLLVLRDEESAAALTDAGAPPPFWIGADPAWALRPRLVRATGAHGVDADIGRSVTVALSHLAGDDRLLDALATAIAPLGDDHEIRLQPWQLGPNGDGGFAERLRDRLDGAVTIIDPPADLDDATATFTGDRLVIGLRFHALVAAAQAGSRFLAVSHEPKLAGLSRRLGQVSVPVHATADVHAAALQRALETEPPATAAVCAEAAAARHTLQLLRLLLDGGDLDEPNALAGLPLSAGSGTW
jgi:polysaccharide pyruvyl transferase WcaK-like protein